jgi:hypothetical protein
MHVELKVERHRGCDDVVPDTTIDGDALVKRGIYEKDVLSCCLNVQTTRKGVRGERWRCVRMAGMPRAAAAQTNQ